MTDLELPEELIKRIEFVLKKRFQLNLNKSEILAKYVLKLSDHYVLNPWAKTPWKEDWCQIAHLVYYLPLNFLRTKGALERKSLSPESLSPPTQLFDFGSGLSPISWYYFLQYSNKRIDLFCEDLEPYPFELLKDMGLPFKAIQINDHIEQLKNKKSLLSFSYSLTEIRRKNYPSWLHKAPRVFILEPSLQEDGRLLMETRDFFLKHNYHILAPCTHQGSCPLLNHSKKDWCHDRIPIQSPEWFKNIENHLPFKNETLTFSYLHVLKNNLATLQDESSLYTNTARIIGDTLNEKGKTRQMICQDKNRQFLTWLHRDFSLPPKLPRGDLIQLDNFKYQTKGEPSHEEIRVLP